MSYLVALLAICAIRLAVAQRNSANQNMHRDGVALPGTVPKFLTGINVLINNNNGTSGCEFFTQSQTSTVSFGNTVVTGFNDSGSLSSGEHLTGWSRSTDNGVTWSDGGQLPDSSFGDGGEPALARDTNTGRIYFAAVGLTDANAIPVFHSDDNGATWQPPVNGTPGGNEQDKECLMVDNFLGAGNGNVYLVSRRGSPQGITFYRSTDGGATFGPAGGTQLTPDSLSQGAVVTVCPDHSLNAFWYDGPSIQVRKSTDQGATFGPSFTAAVFNSEGGINGDLGLIGTLNGGGSMTLPTNRFPHVVVNPVSGNIYCAYNDKISPASPDKSDIFFVQSTDGGDTWSEPTQVNDDATATDQWEPSVVVSTAGDQLGIFYYSRQEDPVSNNLFKYYGRIGTISGGTVTFAAGFAVSDTLSFPENRDSTAQPGFMFNYNQASAAANSFHVTWSDNRNDLPGCSPKKDPNCYYQNIPLGGGTPTPTVTPSATPTPTATPAPRPRPTSRPRPSPAPRP